MKKLFLIGLVVSGLVSCAEESERKPVGPTSASGTIPWNDPGQAPLQGGGQFGMLPQNQHRR